MIRTCLRIVIAGLMAPLVQDAVAAKQASERAFEVVSIRRNTSGADRASVGALWAVAS